MGDILLINPGHDGSHKLYEHKSHRKVHRDTPPLSILYVASYLVENGYDVDLVDTHIEEDYKDIIKGLIEKNKYIFVGISTIIGNFLKNGSKLTRFIRSLDPSIPVVWGGIMASILPETIMQEYSPDYIIRYDGEETALDLAKALEDDSGVAHIKGLSYSRNGMIVHNEPRLPKTDLDEYPIPKWNMLGEHFNREQIPYYFAIMSSRGCPFNCYFCYKHSVDEKIRKKTPPWRFRSAEHIIEEIDHIHEKTGGTVFNFIDDNFLIQKKRAFRILDHFRKNEFYVETCVGHVSLIDDDIIEAMGGIVQNLGFSIETASPKLQKFINKNIDLKSVSCLSGCCTSLHQHQSAYPCPLLTN